MFKNKVSMPVVASSGGRSGYQIKKLTVTENGVYDSEFEAYKPVVVNIPQETTLKALLDETKSASYLFISYKGTSVDGLISYNDTANVTDTSFMFKDCSNLTTIPALDTSKVTKIEQMFIGCINLTTIPLLNTSNILNMGSLFSGCSNLTTIPQLDTSNTTGMYRMFYDCSNLTTIPALDTSKVTTMGYMFAHCTNLTTIPALDVSKCINFESIFWECTSLASIGMYGFTRSITISDTALKHDALVEFLNQAGTAYNSSQRISMGSAKLALLSDEEKAIATNKGWTLA